MPRRPKQITLAEKEAIVQSTNAPMFSKPGVMDWVWLKERVLAVLAGEYDRDDYVRRRLKAALWDDLPPVEMGRR